MEPCFDYNVHPFETIEDGVTFDPKLHLQLELPTQVTTLYELGYTPEEVDAFNLPSDLGVTSSFRVLSDEGVKALRSVIAKVERFAVESPRIPCVLRGCILRSKFIHDFCLSPEVTKHMARIARVPIIPHPTGIQQGHMNFKPKKETTKPVDKWHCDTTCVVSVLFMSDPDNYEGGKFEYFFGTKHEAAKILKETGTLPADRIRRATCQKPGYAVLQQGPAVMHRASAVTQGNERITFVQSYVPTDPFRFMGCDHLSQTYNEVDPLSVLIPDWVRFRSWCASKQLQTLLQSPLLYYLPEARMNGKPANQESTTIDSGNEVLSIVANLKSAVGCPYTESRDEMAALLDKGIVPLTNFVESFQDRSCEAYTVASSALKMLQNCRKDAVEMNGSTMDYY